MTLSIRQKLMQKLFRSDTSLRKQHAVARNPGTRLQLEPLESRTLLSLTPVHPPYLQPGEQQLGSATDSMVVMWGTKGTRDSGNPGEHFKVKYKYGALDWIESAALTQPSVTTGQDGLLVWSYPINGLPYNNTEIEYQFIHYDVSGAINQYADFQNGTPHTTYSYDGKFKTRSAPGDPTTFTFAAYGDSAVDEDVQGASNANFRSVIEEMNDGANTSFALLLGDNVYENGTHEELDARFDTRWHAGTGQDPIPAGAGGQEVGKYISTHVEYYGMGNHDVNPGSQLGGNSTDPNRATLEVRGQATRDNISSPKNGPSFDDPLWAGHNYSFDYGNVHFATIDMNALRYEATTAPYPEELFLQTSGTGSGNVPARTERLRALLNWLIDDMNASDLQWKIVYVHQHLGAGQTNSTVSDPMLIEALNAAKVDLLLDGHLHSYRRSKPITGYSGGAPVGLQVSSPYTKGQGFIEALSGMGGRSEGNASAASWVAAYAGDGTVNAEFGYLEVKAEATKLTVKQISANPSVDPDINDMFEIVSPADTTDPTASLVSPVDAVFSDYDGRLDYDGDADQATTPVLPTSVQIRLRDNGGVGVDDDDEDPDSNHTGTVASGAVSVTKDGNSFTAYTFSYDKPSNVIKLTPTGGSTFAAGTYVVTLLDPNNPGGVDTAIADRATTPNKLPKKSFTIVVDLNALPPESAPTEFQTIIAQDATWKYLDNGSNQGTAWRETAFNDGSWSSGSAQLGYGEQDQATTVNCGPTAPTCNANNFITTYFRRHFTVAAGQAALLTELSIDFLRDDGGSVYINGVEVVRTSNLPGTLGDGSVSYTTTADFNGAGSTENQLDTFPVPAGLIPNLLHDGDNVVAVEIHQHDAASSDISFSLGAQAGYAVPQMALIPFGAPWKYLDDGSDQGTTWRLGEFSSGSLNYLGSAPLGYETSGYSDTQSSNRTIASYGGLPSNKFVTSYFVYDFYLPLNRPLRDLSAQLTYDDGAIVYVNGVELLPRYNMPAGTVTATTLASSELTTPVTTSFTIPAANFVAGRNVIAVEVHQGSAGTTDAKFDFKLTRPFTSVAKRQIFYNNSSWDGNSGAANASDDGAIAIDKSALLPGGSALLVNYTSYNRGINGIMVDLQNRAGTLTAADFTFKVGNSNTPSSWAAAPPPSSVTVRSGAGVGGSDRITVIWPDGAIKKQWLQVTVLANSQADLATSDVFYFGNAIGETGNSATDAQVNAADELAARGNPRNIANPAPVTFLYDYNRDKQVNAADQLISRGNQTNVATRLLLISPPAESGQGFMGGGGGGGESLMGGGGGGGGGYLLESVPTIDVGNHVLQPNTPGQVIEIYVSGGQDIWGFILVAQVGDGGPERTAYGYATAGEDGPSITASTLKAGTIFSSSTGSQYNFAGSLPQFRNSQFVSYDEEGVAADGLLCKLTIDTTGFSSGTWDLLLGGVMGGSWIGQLNSSFALIDADIINGSITIGESLMGGGGQGGQKNEAIAEVTIDLDPSVLGIMLDTIDFEFLLSDSLKGDWGKSPTPLEIQISQSAGKGGGDQVLFKFSAAALAEAGSDGLPPHYLRIRILANKLAGLFDDLELDFDLWGQKS